MVVLTTLQEIIEDKRVKNNDYRKITTMQITMVVLTTLQEIIEDKRETNLEISVVLNLRSSRVYKPITYLNINKSYIIIYLLAENVTCLQDQKRQQIAQAAEKRAKENESKGIKNPEKVKRMQELARQRELQEEEAARSSTEGGLKWQVG
ncbi:uncharacterized protein LOC113467371 [Diaphorina citri]|uniref:Uncharacterized protein LOC113467371 n=1 Tax=Diaphorina citri TaxID=121845 RepID=A0A3Q0IX95_DIACI|nr:uncharacterized protein LOC113467371 [Diaphorina citri]